MNGNGKKRTTAILGLIGAALTILLVLSQVFQIYQQNSTNSAVNNPKTGQVHVHAMLHDAEGNSYLQAVNDRLDLVLLELEQLRAE